MNIIKKLILKNKDPEAFNNLIYSNKVKELNLNYSFDTNKDFYTFKHSGNIGDIIYALPTIIAISNNKPIKIFLNINQKGNYGKKAHPLGDKMLTQKMVEMISPLLLEQPNFISCEIYTNQLIDVDLDVIRKYPLHLNKGNISRWYFLIYNVFYPLEKKWLSVKPNNKYNNTIVIARSQRYNAPDICYNFLSQYSNLAFIGTPEEYNIIKNQITNIQYLPVNNFLETAEIIAGSKLFIGNQSFPFAIAEALKVKRLLEWYYLCPNVNIAGQNGYDFCIQEHFEELVKKLL